MRNLEKLFRYLSYKQCSLYRSYFKVFFGKVQLPALNKQQPFLAAFFTYREIELSLKNMKNDKASGPME